MVAMERHDMMIEKTVAISLRGREEVVHLDERGRHGLAHDLHHLTSLLSLGVPTCAMSLRMRRPMRHASINGLTPVMTKRGPRA